MAEGEYIAVTNIPEEFHAAELRAHFSSFVENKSFICFHFRHRPEKPTKKNEAIEEESDLASSGNNPKTTFTFNSSEQERLDLNLRRKISTKCCVIKVVKSACEDFVTKYNDQYWTDVDGQYLGSLCHLSIIKLRKERPDQGSADEKDLLSMPELRPPEMMPHGNVGTPTLLFLDLIQKCLLPKTIINKLRLKFPSTQAKRLYSKVSFKYKNSEQHLPQQLTIMGDMARVQDKNVTSPCCLTFKGKFVSHNENNISASPEVASDSDFSQNVNFSAKFQPAVAESHNQDIMHLEKSTSLLPTSKLHSEFASLSTAKSEMIPESSTAKSFFCETETFKIPESSNISSSKSVAASSQSPSSVSSFSSNHLGMSMPIVKGCEYLEQVSVSANEKTLTRKERKRLEKLERRKTRALMDERIEERLIQIEKRYHNEDDAEEWDRHEAVEDDPSNQERNKERLYEEEIEQPWEKGGPGVVFYTDAMYWQAKDGDFDEQTADDLDIDFSPYEGDGPGDKDIQDFLKIRQEKRFRDGYDRTDRFSIGLSKKPASGLDATPSGFSSLGAKRPSRQGQFECHTKGIGRKLMEKHGWQDGQGLGASGSGIKEALRGDGQNPHTRKGLGFVKSEPVRYGPSVLKKARVYKPPLPHLITTVKDDPQVTDPKEPLLQRNEPTHLKHRQTFLEDHSG